MADMTHVHIHTYTGQVFEKEGNVPNVIIAVSLLVTTLAILVHVHLFYVVSC